jgi:hypothetical protein
VSGEVALEEARCFSTRFAFGDSAFAGPVVFSFSKKG